METVVVLRAEVQRLHGVRNATRARRACGRPHSTAVSTLGPHSLEEARVSGDSRGGWPGPKHAEHGPGPGPKHAEQGPGRVAGKGNSLNSFASYFL